MKAIKVFSPTKVFAILLTALTLQACGSGSDSASYVQQGEIFTEVSVDSVSEAGQTQAIEESRRTRFVQVNFGLLKDVLSSGSGTLRLNLFDDKVVTIILDDVNKVSDSNIVATGHITGDHDSAATVVMNGNALVANVRFGKAEEAYEVRAGSNGVHVVAEPVVSEDTGCPAEDAPEVAGDAPMINMNKVTAGQDTVMAIPVVSMLVAYTPIARSRQGGTSAMQALIQMGIADTNTALANSGANLRVRLAGTIEVSQNETGSWSSDLSYLRSKTDSRWNEVHAKRTAVGADQVTMIGSFSSSSSTAGIGYIRASYSYAFTVVKASAFGMYTFTHELGHNIGLNHSDGYVNSAGRFRTIMAYGSYPRIRRFSNPNLTYNGYRTGTSYDNSVKIVNYNASRMGGLTGSTYSVSADEEQN